MGEDTTATAAAEAEGGRPNNKEHRPIINGILWVLAAPRSALGGPTAPVWQVAHRDQPLLPLECLRRLATGAQGPAGAK